MLLQQAPLDAGNTRRQDALAALVLTLLTALFYFAFFNKFAGIRSGDGEFSGGLALLAGKLPYRDYFTAGPPLNQLKSAAELALFGKTLLVSRSCAVLERVAGGLLLFAWLRRYFTAAGALLGSLTSILVCASDFPDSLASYSHDAVFLAMLAGFGTCVSLRRQQPTAIFLWACLAGIGASTSALTKQTVGLGVAATLLVAASAAWLMIHPRRTLLWLVGFALGFVVPVATVLLYLKHLGVLHAALQMLFVSGPSAKAGHPGDFPRRALYAYLLFKKWLVVALLGLALGARPLWSALIAPTQGPAPRYGTSRFLLSTLIVGVLLFAACLLSLSVGSRTIEYSYMISTFFTLIGTTLFGAALLFRGLTTDTARVRVWELAIFASVGWAIAVTVGLSWPALAMMALPGLGLLLAALYDGAPAARVVLCCTIALFCALQLRAKL